MATNRRIVSTPLDGLNPLGTAGQRSFALITRAVREKFGEEHEFLFAEPVPSPAGDTIDWYSGARAPLVPIDRLDEDQRQLLIGRLGALVSDILGYASQLESSDAPEKKRLGAALRNATEIPDDTYIYASGDQPVVVCWSHLLNLRQAPQGVLRAYIPATPRPVVEPPAGPPSQAQVAAVAVLAREPGFGWLWWLMWLFMALVTAAMIYLLVTACGLSGLRGLNFCPVRVAASVTAEEDRGAILGNELAQLQRQLGLTDLQCRPVIPEPERRAEVVPIEPPDEVIPPDEVEEPADEDEQRVEDAGGDTDVDLRITLFWETSTDLDLSVICPNGKKISYQKKINCGGVLDIDANAADASIMSSPVENIVFEENPPRGRYTIEVVLFKTRNNRRRNPFRVTVIIRGSEPLTFTGSLSVPRSRKRFTFNIP